MSARGGAIIHWTKRQEVDAISRRVNLFKKKNKFENAEEGERERKN